MFLEETVLPLGRIQVNGLKELTRVGSALSKEFSEPSLFDLDDIRDLSESSTQSNDEESDNNSVQSDRDEPVTIKNSKFLFYILNSYSYYIKSLYKLKRKGSNSSATAF